MGGNEIDQEKLDAVTQWLRTKYRDGDLPAFEVNSETVSALYELSKTNIARDKRVALAAEAEKVVGTECEAESKRLWAQVGAVLDDSGALGRVEDGKGGATDKEAESMARAVLRGAPSWSDESGGGGAGLSALAQVGEALDLKDVTTGAYLCALSDLTLRWFKIHAALVKEKGEKQRNEQAAQEAAQELGKMESLLAGYAEARERERNESGTVRSEVEYFQQKASEYRRVLDGVRAKLQDSGLRDDYRHGPLEAGSKAWQELRDQADELRESLEKYHELPANLTDAKVALEGARRELADVEARVNAGIESMGLSTG